MDGLAANLDLYATFATLAGGEEPKAQAGYMSQDLSAALPRGEPSPRRWWSYGSHAYRSGNYKIYLATKDRPSNPDTRKREPMAKHDPPLLFDLCRDFGEQNNIAGEHPGLVKRLVNEMQALRNAK